MTSSSSTVSPTALIRLPTVASEMLSAPRDGTSIVVTSPRAYRMDGVECKARAP